MNVSNGGRVRRAKRELLVGLSLGVGKCETRDANFSSYLLCKVRARGARREARTFLLIYFVKLRREARGARREARTFLFSYFVKIRREARSANS